MGFTLKGAGHPGPSLGLYLHLYPCRSLRIWTAPYSDFSSTQRSPIQELGLWQLSCRPGVDNVLERDDLRYANHISFGRSM